MSPTTKTETTPPPEWVDAKEARRIFCIGRSTLYSLADAGKIRSSSLRDRGKKRGKRLFDYDSIKKHIERNVEGGSRHEH
jgi:hypothetical protein